MKEYKNELFYGDVNVGDVFETASRTITDSDIFQFAGLTGDFNELHTSDMFAKETAYGQRIAHGMLTLAVANGLYMRLGCFHSVFLEIKEWKFLKPVLVNDTIWLRMTLESKRLTKNPKKGIFTWKYEVFNQNDVLVAEGSIVRMMDNADASDTPAA